MFRYINIAQEEATLFQQILMLASHEPFIIISILFIERMDDKEAILKNNII
ncbi:unnamed protein product [Paramecium pentaurelia]|uniref:Uncharacterized protein n=1 Tax=Paramecium pentaurelia TaxID=43138 RepID=A0A8S1TAF7_9CILI|nr:unnamed protein product [Paramecium pentaurelia]